MIKLPELNFPKKFDFRIKQNGSKIVIFDEIRQKYLPLTPEEFIRQNWIHYFLEYKQISKSALILEKQILLHKTIKRLDILVLDKTQPEILIECKAPQIQLTKKTFEQVARYNSIIKADKIMITNGINHLLFKYCLEQENYLSIDFNF